MQNNQNHSGSTVWLFAKGLIIALACANSLYQESAPLENFSPILYPVIFVIVLIGFSFFLSKALSKNGYISGSLRASLWVNPIKFPLPFFLFAALVSLFTGVVLTVKYWGDVELVPNGLIRIVFSIAILVAIFLATRRWAVQTSKPWGPSSF